MGAPEELTEEERAEYDQIVAEIIAGQPFDGDPEQQALQAGERALAAIHARRRQIRDKQE